MPFDVAIRPAVDQGSSEFVINEAGEDKDFRVEGDTDEDLLFTDASGDKVGIGTSSPVAKLDIDQGALDTLLIAGTSSDVVHGMTNFAPTDRFFYLKKREGSAGGIDLAGLSDANSVTGSAIRLLGLSSVPTTSSATSSHGVVEVWGGKANGVSFQLVGDTENLFSISNGNVTRALMKGNGDFLMLAGSLFIGDTSNANMSQGLTLNQGGFDDLILALKSSDVAHGVTGRVETDTFGSMGKVNAVSGGVSLEGFSEDVIGLQFLGVGTNANTTVSTSGSAATVLVSGKKSGTGIADYSSGENIFAITNWSTTELILRGNGDLWLNGNPSFNGVALTTQASKINDPSGVATAEDTEARAAIVSIIDVLEAVGLSAAV